MVNNAKLDLGRTLNSHGPHGSRGGNTCHHYGSVSGCDVGCPALWDGECEVIAEVVESIDISEEELLELEKNITH